jgi:nitrite reductase/ring-hydroxylating ferredoxin subunit
LQTRSANFVRAARLDDVRAAGQMSVRVAGHSLALFFHDGKVYAVDNRCPHMGFPLHRGSVSDGILTCHWHHARFDLESGGTFDQFADEARVFPVEIKDGEVWVDLTPKIGRASCRERV